MAEVKPVGRAFVYRKDEKGNPCRFYMDTKEMVPLDDVSPSGYSKPKETIDWDDLFEKVAPAVQARKVNLMATTASEKWKASIKTVGFKWWKFWQWYPKLMQVRDIRSAKTKMLKGLMDFAEIERWFKASGIEFSSEQS